MYAWRRNLGRRYCETPGEGAGGAGGQQRLTAADLLARHGASPERLAERLEQAYGENFTLREKNRGLTTEVAALTERQVPQGATVLTGDAAKAYEAYKGFGKPDEIGAKLTERDTLAAEVAAVKRNETLRAVAEAAGWNPAPLRRIGADREYELRDVTTDGTTVKVPYIKDGDAFTPLAEYAASAWADVLPALQAGQGQGGNGTGGGTNGGGSGGVSYPAQRGGSGQQQQPAQVALHYVTSTYKGPPKRG